MAITLSDLRTRVLDRADMTGSAFAVEARVNEYINNALSELYDLLVETHEDYFYDVETITLVSGTEDYDLPSDFYKVLKVFYLSSGGVRSPMRRFTLDMLDRYGNEWVPSTADGVYTMYRVIGDKIRFSPEPAGAGSAELYYIPQFEEMDGDDTDVTFTLPQIGWIDYAVVDAAMQLLIREESDVSALMARKAEMKDRIKRAAEQRDAGEPDSIIDYYRLNVESVRGPW